MFTRRKQSVTADELEQDLAVLMPDAAVRPEDLTPVPDPEGPWTIASVTNTGAHLRLVLSDASGRNRPAT